jgi:hypothetical protein
MRNRHPHINPVLVLVLAAVAVGAGVSWFCYEVLLPSAAEADIFLWLLLAAALGFYVLALAAEKIAEFRELVRSPPPRPRP